MFAWKSVARHGRNSYRRLQLISLNERNLPATIDGAAVEVVTPWTGLDPELVTWIGDVERTVLVTVPYKPAVATQPALERVALAAINRWIDAGATPEQVTYLRSIQLQIADLGVWSLGAAHPEDNTIVIDDDAATWGWNFEQTGTVDPELVPAFAWYEHGTVDLLTVLTHEFGHFLGHTQADGGLMAEANGAGMLIVSRDDNSLFLVAPLHCNYLIGTVDEAVPIEPIEQLDPLLSAWDPTADGLPASDIALAECDDEMSVFDQWIGVDDVGPVGEFDGAVQAGDLGEGDCDFASQPFVDELMTVGEADQLC